MKVIKDQFKKFITNKEPYVFALRGNWGVGKTYLWNKYIKENKDKLSCEYYSYVSLFGINSIDELKRSIFENMIKKNSIGTLPDLNTFSENAKNFIDKLSDKKERNDTVFHLGHKASGLLSKIPFVQNFTAAFDSISFMSINTILICLDDIERRGKGLEIREIFGLCNYLKEQRGCKVLIILNDTKEEFSDYKEYREKIIDADLLLSPTPKECNKIVFDEEYKNLQKNCELLNITNIRLLKKIKKMYEELIKFNDTLHKRIIEQIENSLPLFMYCFYSGNDDIPDLQFVITNSFNSDIPDSISEQEKQRLIKWKSFIKSSNYISTDKLDYILAKFVSQGYAEKDTFNNVVKNITQVIEVEEKNIAFNEAINNFKNSFDGDPKVLIDTIKKTFKENINNTTRENLDFVVRILRECNDSQSIEEFINSWIEEHKSHYECFDLSENYIYHEIQDEEIIKKFNELFMVLYKDKEKSQNRIFEKIKNQEGLDETDLYILSKTGEDSLISFIKTLNIYEIRAFLKFINVCKTYTDYKHEIYDNSMKAFKKMYEENKLNIIRFKYWGIDISNVE